VRTYALYLESGPKRRKTMVHIPELAGCVQTGPTTDEAVAATPDAIRAFLGFIARHGEPADPAEPFETRIAGHFTEGSFIGQGEPAITFESDLEPLSDAETRALLGRFAAMREELAAWAERQPDEYLDAAPERGRSARRILLHVLSVPGAYLGASLGGAKGFSRLQTEAERGLVPLPEALRRVITMTADRVWEATPEQRRAVVERPAYLYTLRKSLRRLLSHEWEHLSELSRRPGGPVL
jgi:uncharacterized damage-inducible protein DinB/predicted RNase H-like HicB family nuclease